MAGVQNGAIAMENSMERPQNLKPVLPCGLAISLLAFLQRIQVKILSRFLHYSTHCSIIHQSPGVDIISLSIRWMNSENGVYTNNEPWRRMHPHHIPQLTECDCWVRWNKLNHKKRNTAGIHLQKVSKIIKLMETK